MSNSNTLLYFLFAVIPGLYYCHFFSHTKNPKKDASTQTVHRQIRDKQHSGTQTTQNLEDCIIIEYCPRV